MLEKPMRQLPRWVLAVALVLPFLFVVPIMKALLRHRRDSQAMLERFQGLAVGQSRSDLLAKFGAPDCVLKADDGERWIFYPPGRVPGILKQPCSPAYLSTIIAVDRSDKVTSYVLLQGETPVRR